MIMSVDFLAKEGNGTYIALFPFSFIDSELIIKTLKKKKKL